MKQSDSIKQHKPKIILRN